MEPLFASEQARRGVWGVILIAVGSALLLDRLHFIRLHLSGDWWPASVILFGVARAVTAPSLRKMLDGVSFAMLGVWFFACNEHWYGLSYHTGWPLVLVIFGGEAVLRSLLERPNGDASSGRLS